METHRIDLFQLECLQVVVAERHVTRAADRLGLSQAKLSSILARLRVLTGDMLLVRTAQGMEPTACALELAEHAAQLLQRINGTLSKHASFNPKIEQRSFSIHAVDYLVFTVITPLIAHLRDHAPGIRLMVAQPQIAHVREALESSEADLVLSHIADTSETLLISHLMSMEYCCVAAADHPSIQGSISVDQYMAAGHVCASFGRKHTPYVSEQALDSFLEGSGRKRNKVIEVPAILVIPDIVARSDLIATIPLGLAKRAADLGLQTLPLPFQRPPIDVSMIWHRRSHNDPAHEWLRTAVRQFSRGGASA